MDKEKALNKLKVIKEETLKKMHPETGGYDTRILVHMGTCGIASGAKEVMNALTKEIELFGANGIKVVITGCAGMCSTEPNVTVYKKGLPTVIYKYVDAAKMRQIFRRHILAGEIQTDFVLAKIIG